MEYLRSFPQLFFQQAARRPHAVAIRHKELGVWQEVSWGDYERHVRRTAAALLGLGLKAGENVVILGENRPEWLYCDLATMSVGGATCGIYPTSSPEQVAYIVKHCGARLIFVDGEEQLDKVLAIRAQVPVEKVVVWDRKGLWGFQDPNVTFFDDFLEHAGSGRTADLDGRLRAIEPDQTAVLIYTSGTTGPPKGAMLTHGNLLYMAEALSSANPVYETDQIVSYLPLCHIYERLLSLIQGVKVGYTVNFAESMETLFQNIREVSPTFFGSVPRIWEKLLSQIELMVADSTWVKRKAYRWALENGRRVGRRGVNGGPRSVVAEGPDAPPPLRSGDDERNRHGIPASTERVPPEIAAFVHRISKRSLFWNLRRQLGFERTRFALCGAAPAAPDLFEYFNAIGIPLYEGYGQTESTGVISIHREGRARSGTVGEPIAGMETRIAEDGEIVVRGPGVFKGYFKDAELTSQTVKDGWLHTGDVGTLEDGHLRILDRKKDILITAGGKNITPSYIENKLKFSPYVQDAVVVGDGRKYLIGLILIEEDNVTRYAQDHRISFTTFADLTQNAEIRKLIGREVDEVNKTLSSVEGVKKFALLPRRFYEEDGDVTPTKKVKRKALEQKYKDLIEQLYRDR